MTRSGRFDFEDHLLSDVHDAPASARLLGMALATFADGNTCELGDHSPSLTTLERRTKLTRRTICAHLALLEDRGWLIRRRPSLEAQAEFARNKYRLEVPTAVRSALVSARATIALPSEAIALGVGEPLHLPRATAALTTTDTTTTPTDRDEIARQVAEGLAKRPGIDITVGWALKIVTQVLDSSSGQVRNPVAYVLKAVRDNPARYRPTSGPPPIADVLAGMRGDVA